MKRALENLLGKDTVRENVVLAPYTTMQLGGPADLFVEVTSADALAYAIKTVRELDFPHFLLGYGANIVIGDAGFRGVVIRNAAKNIDFDGNRVTAESGAIVYPDLIEACVTRSLSGLEHYVGIPSTVGGALWQNLHFLSPAPARERTMFIEEVLEHADLMTAENDLRRVDVDYFEFGYDYSILHRRNDVVLRATFRLTPAQEVDLRKIMAENLAWRALRHPPLDTEPSVGSIFKKIQGIGAGRLIDECRLKGASFGGITVTHRHANIMVNQGGGTAADVQALVAYVQKEVAVQTGYHLETEVDFIGEFDPPTSGPPAFIPRPPGLITAEELAARRTT